MNPLVRFMVSPAGQIARAAIGVAIIAAGLIGVGGSAGLAIAALGLIPLLAGSLNICIIAPAFRLPLSGSKIRAMK